MNHRLAVTGLGVIAPGVTGPGDALRPASPPEEDWFQLTTALPGRGYKRLPSGSKYLLAAARAALADARGYVESVEPELRGAVVGTNNANAALLDEMDRTIIDEGAAALSPTTAPFMAMSLFSSRMSPEHGLNGFNLTANSPGSAGIESLQIAARALAAGRASVLLVGAVEEAPPAEQFDGAADVGAAVLVCEGTETAVARGARIYGLCEVRTAFLDPSGPDTGDVLDRLWGDTPSWHVDAVIDDSPVGTAVRAWLSARFPDPAFTMVPTSTDAGCLAPVRRVVGRLAGGPERITGQAVLAASAHGNLALAVLHPIPDPTNPTNPTNPTDRS
ncbi:beta-ketoacyl synthase N-terminal-like domain-containing protein [Streptosporangium sp. NPDC000396]|uniref:beta-ketoacyl synthase N-terminal-like domain-containing protein n=1 Tax=Streptosporangium sp. NPDC000396 TaxID=3366185 RepID=UPI0036D0242A